MATGGDSGNIAKENISDLVTCPLCLEYYQRPKLLPCGHSVCQECLQVYIDKTLNNGALLCPICRTDITLPKDGTGEFIHNFHIGRLQDEYNKVPVNRSCDPCSHSGDNISATSKCAECCEYLCADCVKAHRRVRLSRNHHITSIGGDVVDVAEETKKLSNLTIKCNSHQDEVVRYFCLPCKLLICRDCKALDHTDHKVVTFQEAIKDKREEMRRDLSNFQNEVFEVTRTVGQISQNISTLEYEKTYLVISIGEKRDRFIQMITQVADKAIGQVDKIMSAELNIQKTELEKAQFLKTQMESRISCTDVLLSNGTDVEVLHGYQLTKERKSNLSSESVSAPGYQILILQSCSDSAFTAGVKKYFTLTNQENSTVEQSPLLTQASETAKAIKMGHGIESLRRLSTIPTPGCAFVSGIALNDNNYMFICVDGNLQCFDGERWTNFSRICHTEEKAYSVCVDSNRAYHTKDSAYSVCDYYSTRHKVAFVVPLNSNGGYPTEGRGCVGEVNINAVVVSKKRDNDLVQLIVPDIIEPRRTTITLPFRSDYPTITCGQPVRGLSTYYMISVLSNPAVYHIDCQGKLLQTYGKGELSHPVGMAVDIKGNLVVSDPSVNDVIIYKRDGSIKRRLRQRNNLRKNQLSSPKGVCIDANGYIFVASFYTHSVLLFSSSGDYIRTVLDMKDGILNPGHISVSKHRHLAVCNNCQNGPVKINLYKY